MRAYQARRCVAAIVLGFTVIAYAHPVLAQNSAPPAGLRATVWSGFRGSGGIGHAARATPPLTWNAVEGRNTLWKTVVTNHGMSSPIISANRLFVTAADDVARQILCYDTDTGKLLWHHAVTGIPDATEHGLPKVLQETGYASPTPVTDGQYVAAVFATGELVCLKVTGERVWARHLGMPKNHYGHASSLTRHENLLIVQYDEQVDPRLLAFELDSGKPAWQVKRGALSWSSPILVDNNGRTELILTDSKGVDGYDPKTGHRRWRVDCLAGEVATSAAFAEGVVFVASEGAAATAIDISKHDAEPEILWQWDEALPDASSPLAGQDLLILPTAFGVVTCLEARSGKVHWEHDFGVGFSSSPILVNNAVYLTDLSGTTQIFKLARVFEQVGVGKISEDVYATPAFVGGRIYLRGLNHIWCLAEGATVETAQPLTEFAD